MIMRLTGQRPALRHCDLTGLWYAVERPSYRSRVEQQSNEVTSKSNHNCNESGASPRGGLGWTCPPHFCHGPGVDTRAVQTPKSFLLQGAWLPDQGLL